MSNTQTPREFVANIAHIQRNVTSDEIKKKLRSSLFRIAGHMRKSVGRDMAASLPALGARADGAVRRTVFKSLTGFRIRVSNSRKNGMVPTGRALQPYLPLPFWYEHGFRAHRLTRRKGFFRRRVSDRGPSTPRQGVGVLARHLPELDRAEREYEAALIEYLLPNLNKING